MKKDTGYYFNRKDWTISLDKSKNSVRIPTVLMLLLAPVLGGTFVVFLPLLGLGMLGWYGMIKPFKNVLKLKEEAL